MYSNKEIREAPTGYVSAKIEYATGRMIGPQCCGEKMAVDGGCAFGCCDDYKCATCGYTVRIEWPD